MEKVKHDKNLLFVIIGIVVLVLGFLLVFMTSKKENKDDSKDNQEAKILLENGIYSNGNGEARLIINGENGSLKYISNGQHYNYELMLKDDVYVTFFEESLIIIKSSKENEIEIISNKEEVYSGVYSKTKDYDNDEILKDYYGDTSYLHSDLSGIYKSGDTILYLLQSGENTIVMRLNDNDYTMGFDKKEEGIYVNTFSN